LVIRPGREVDQIADLSRPARCEGSTLDLAPVTESQTQVVRDLSTRVVGHVEAILDARCAPPVKGHLRNVAQAGGLVLGAQCVDVDRMRRLQWMTDEYEGARHPWKLTATRPASGPHAQRDSCRIIDRGLIPDRNRKALFLPCAHVRPYHRWRKCDRPTHRCKRPATRWNGSSLMRAPVGSSALTGPYGRRLQDAGHPTFGGCRMWKDWACDPPCFRWAHRLMEGGSCGWTAGR
jgi:hypothetical protein